MKPDSVVTLLLIAGALITGLVVGYQAGSVPRRQFEFHVGGTAMPMLFRCDRQTGRVVAAMPSAGPRWNWVPVEPQ